MVIASTAAARAWQRARYLFVFADFKAIDALGTHPFDFFALEPTYALGLQLKGSGAIDYDPERDIVEVAAAIAALEHLSGPMLEERVKMPAARINHAVQFLDDHGHARVMRALGTGPYDFYQVSATPSTRRFVTRHAV